MSIEALLVVVMSAVTFISWIALNKRSAAAVACAVGILLVTGKWCCATEEVRGQRADRKREKQLRELADKISAYGRKVQQQYPSGEVVVDETDLAERLRSRPSTVAAALNVLVGEEKVQRAPLSGYWKLNL